MAAPVKREVRNYKGCDHMQATADQSPMLHVALTVMSLLLI